MEILLNLMIKALRNASPMSSWLKQNAKTLKQKEDFYADKLRLMSIIEGDLQFTFRIIMKRRLYKLMEEKNCFVMNKVVVEDADTLIMK